MAVTQKVTLYNNKFTVPPVINAVQNDTDRQVEAYFGDFTLQVGMTGVLSFIRSDRTHYEVSATLDTATNTATAELDQALTQAGVTQAQLKITDSGNVGSTFTFMIKVQPDVAGISVPQDGWSAQEFDQRLTDAENAIDAVEEDVADLQDKEYDYAPVITDTASGAIASFPDGADSYPLKSCVVDVDAVQDLHGYDNPWPAGGGKNKLQFTLDSIKALNTTGTWSGNTYTVGNRTYRVDTDNGGNVTQIVANGSDSSASALIILSSQTLDSASYILSGISGGSAPTYEIGVKLNESSNFSHFYNTSSSISITSMVQMQFVVRENYFASNITVKPMLRLATKSDETYAPPSNICPITGFSTAKVTRTGANVWDEEWELGTYDSETGLPVVNNTAIRSKNDNPIRVKPSETYYFNTPNAERIYYYDENDNYISRSSSISNGTFTTPNNCKYARFFIGANYGTTYNHDISVNSPSTDTAYHQYVGQTVTISLGDTRYGCKLDVTRGKLRVTELYFDFSSVSWVAQTKSRWFYNGLQSTIKKPSTTAVATEAISDTFKSVSNDDIFSDESLIGLAINNNGSVVVRNGSTTTEPTGHMVYPLATPIEVDLTPTEITTLLGTNNIFSDTGDVEITYCADTKRYIQKLISQIA